jgi:hypothetical protein
MTRRDQRHGARPPEVPDRAAPRFGTLAHQGCDDARSWRCYHRAMEWMVVLIIALIVVIMWRGPKTLPLIGRAFGQGVKEARKEIGEIRTDLAGRGDKPDDDASKPA